jgi:glycosyltransferase involved in cell wall biosynthesis
MKKIKILLDSYIFESSPNGGIARYFREVLPIITERHPDISFILMCNVENSDIYPKGRNIEYRCPPRPWHPFRLFGRINAYRKRLYTKNILKKDQPDIFHSTYYQSPPAKNLKTVVTIYDFINLCWSCLATDRNNFIDLQASAINNADALVSISEVTQSDLYKYFPEIDKSISHVIHLGVSNDFSKIPASDNNFAEKWTHNQPFFLFVGERGSYKNFMNLLAAFAKIAHKTNTYLVVAGGSLMLSEPHINLIISSKIQDRVILTGKLSEEDLRHAYSAAAAFVFPSIKEGFGLPVLEAMASEVPTVISDIPAFHEVAGDAALYFDPHDSEDIAMKLTEALDQDTAAKLCLSGKQRICLFNWKKSADSVADIYRKL